MERKQGIALALALALPGLALARRLTVDLSKLPPRLEPYREAFRAALVRYPVDPELLMALVIQESGGNPEARRHEPEYQARYVSGNPRWDRARALGWSDEDLATSWGLTQILGTTAWGELGFHEPPKEILDPVKNLKLGAHYLKKKLRKWGNTYEALLAYNGGDGAVYAYRAGNCYNCRYADNVLALKKRIERGEPV